jgi:hypothetical protein
MTEADDNVVELRDLDQLFEDILAGQALGPEAPAWSADLARLVQGARVEAVPGELAGHDDIVASMTEARRSAAADGRADDAGEAGAREAGDRAALPLRPVADAVASPDDEVVAAAATESAGAPHAPRHALGARGYRAKHAAARTPTPGGPTARDVGRLIAVKAVAVTTAVVVGTVAAAAATTGIVANVVVPALTSNAPDAPPTSKTTTTQRSGAGGVSGVEDDDVDGTVPVPACQLSPVCSPLTPAFPAPDDSVPARPTGPTVPTTDRPSTSTTIPDTPATTTTTEAPPTSEPGPTTTITEPPPTTQPEPLSTPAGGG